MRQLWLVGGLIALLIITGLGYQALRASPVSQNTLSQLIFTYDILIKNVVIVDGSGADRQYGCIGILGDKITAIGPTLKGRARQVIDAKGLYAAPGFIDLGPQTEPNSRKLLMGVTTQVVRNVNPSSWATTPQETNLAWLIDLEKIIDLETDGSVTVSQLRGLGERLSIALQAGTSGVYLNGSSSTATLLRNDNTIWSALAAEGCKLYWEMPDDDPDVRDMVTGLLARASAHQVPIHLSGINLSHPSTWGRVYDIINLIDRAGSAAISGDVVPYFEQPQVADRDLVVFVSHPALAIASNSDPQHPSTVGAYPRLLQRFVNQEPILSIEEAIQKSSSLPASILGLKERGLLRVGYYADLVLFDGSTINAPTDLGGTPQGIHTVIVNGQIAVEAGKQTDEKAGRLLAMTPKS